jgi:hypothetical protein
MIPPIGFLLFAASRVHGRARLVVAVILAIAIAALVWSVIKDVGGI